MKKFDDLREEYYSSHRLDRQVVCFLPVHLTEQKQETNLRKKGHDNPAPVV